jgi:uncharacterized OB-fold protein
MGELVELPKSETQIAEERMAAVERQVHKVLPAGSTRAILCPYCGSWNFPHQSFCCETLRFAVVTICVADRALKTAQANERAMVN